MYGTAERVRRAEHAARRFLQRAAVRRLGALCGVLTVLWMRLHQRDRQSEFRRETEPPTAGP